MQRFIPTTIDSRQKENETNCTGVVCSVGSRWNYILRQLQQQQQQPQDSSHDGGPSAGTGMNVLMTDVNNVFVRYLDMSEFEDSPFDSYHAYAGTVDAFPRNIY